MRNKVKLNNKKMLLVPAGLLAAALISGVAIYWIAFWFVIMWFFVSFIWLMYTAKNIDVDLELDPKVIERKDIAHLKIRLFNDSFLPFPYGTFKFEAMHQLKKDGIFEIVDGSETLNKPIEITDVHPLGGWQINFQIYCHRRGRHPIGPIYVTLSSPFGIIDIEMEVQEIRQINVLPRLLSLNGKIAPQASEPQGTRKKQLFSPMDYTELYDLRPFVHGDPPKLINWKVSAKHNELYIKRVENTGEMKVLLCIDLDPRLYSSAETQDWLLESMLSLMRHQLNSGVRTGVLTFDREVRFFPPTRSKNAITSVQHFFLDLSVGAVKSDLLTYLINGSWDLKDYHMFYIVPTIHERHEPVLKKLQSKVGALDVLTADFGLHASSELYKVSYFFKPDTRDQVRVREVNFQ